MKYLLFITISMLLSVSCYAQTADEIAVKNTVNSFFDAFHKKDTIALQTYVYGYVELQSISRDKEGKVQLHTDPYLTFVRSIGAIPDNVTFEERLLDYSIQIDGDMANVWTPYEFYLNGAFSHCGVNSFQFIRTENGWKIIYLVDTRRKKACK